MTEKDQIVLVERKLQDAVKMGNLSALENLLHDKLLFVDQTGAVLTKELKLETYRAGMPVIVGMQILEQNIRIKGQTAMVTSVYHVSGYNDGQPFEDKYRYQRVWKNTAACWQLILASCTVVPVIEPIFLHC